MSPAEIVSFWTAAGPKAWFAHDPAFDAAIRDQFEPAHQGAARGEFADWGKTAEGSLALLLLLDQFPRNLYRQSPHAFATDGLARQIAVAALEAGHDQAFAPDLRAFFYLPFEHAEDLGFQERSVALMRALGVEEYTQYAIVHRDIIARFGRFPHRNAALGRVSSKEELDFLAAGGFAG